MKAALLTITTSTMLIAVGCTVTHTPAEKRVVSPDTRHNAVLIANAEAIRVGYDLSEFGEPTNTGPSGIADPTSSAWSFDYSTCGKKWTFDCKGFTVTVDKTTGKAEALAWQ